jgi:hypothetical protein
VRGNRELEKTAYRVASRFVLITKYYASDKIKVHPDGRSLAGNAGSNPAGGHGCLSFVNIVHCEIEVSAMVRSLVQWSPTECACVLVFDQVQQ